jgi:DNA-binding PadR family transcriptional regulator
MAESTSRDLFPGALEMMILESLRRQPAHGYALVQHIQQRSNNLLQVEEGSLYPALQRLLKAKLVKAAWGVPPQSPRERLPDHGCGPSPFGEADLQLRTHV